MLLRHLAAGKVDLIGVGTGILNYRNYHGIMRVTVTIDDDVLTVARALAEQKGYSLGSVLSELARRGLRSTEVGAEGRDGTTFPVASNAEPITSEDVYRSLDDLA